MTRTVDVANRVVLVTGAAGGIGQALCRAFAAEGMRVGVRDINGGGAERLAAEPGAADTVSLSGRGGGVTTGWLTLFRRVMS